MWSKLPRLVQEQIIQKKIKFYVIDGYKVAQQTGMGAHVQHHHADMLLCNFRCSSPRSGNSGNQKFHKENLRKKGDQIVQQNFAAVDQTLANLFQVTVPSTVSSTIEMPPVVSNKAPQFVKDVTAMIMAGSGDLLPVSKMPIDGTYPTGTAAWEKRNIAMEIPEWIPEICIQCNKSALVCPHATIRIKVFDQKELSALRQHSKRWSIKVRNIKG